MSISNGACIFQLADKTVHGKSGMSVTLLPGQTSINSLLWQPDETVHGKSGIDACYLTRRSDIYEFYSGNVPRSVWLHCIIIHGSPLSRV